MLSTAATVATMPEIEKMLIMAGDRERLAKLESYLLGEQLPYIKACIMFCQMNNPEHPWFSVVNNHFENLRSHFSIHDQDELDQLFLKEFPFYLASFTGKLNDQYSE